MTRWSLWCIVPTLVAPVAFGADADDIAALLKVGATQSALTFIDARQNKPDLAPGDWVALERQRLTTLRAINDASALLARVESLPESVPVEFRREAWSMAAETQLDAGENEHARGYLLRIIWSEGVGGEQLGLARRLVIRSYLQAGDLDDAQAAVLRYKQDYPSGGEAWQILQAELLLRSGDAAGAIDVLAGMQSHEAQLLRMTATLRAKRDRPPVVLTGAKALVSKLSARPELQRAALVFLAETAQASNDLDAQTFALERALSLPDAGKYVLFKASGDDLWRLYDRFADKLGNSAHLLVGNHRAWLDYAATLAPTRPSAARALYAFVSQQADDAEVRAVAAREFATSLAKGGFSATVEALYAGSTRFPDAPAIPREARYVLAERAIAAFDIQLAAQLVRELDVPPAGETEEEWMLRRARVFLYAGDADAAVALLKTLLQGKHSREPAFIGRLLQVLFDLQAVGRYRDSLALLERVDAAVERENGLRRELFFWMADALVALKRYAEAADLYLRSAAFGGADVNDPWAQSARFQAAGALAHAGAIDEARSVYLKLLGITADARRRAEIQHQVQQLWLNRSSISTQ